MKKLFKLSTLAVLVTSANAYAHHPAEDMIDPEVYEMIEENISEVHLAMTFDDMGSDTTDMGGAMNSRDDDAGSMAADMGSELDDVGAAMESVAEMSSIADIEPGSMNGQR